MTGFLQNPFRRRSYRHRQAPRLAVADESAAAAAVVVAVAAPAVAAESFAAAAAVAGPRLLRSRWPRRRMKTVSVIV